MCFEKLTKNYLNLIVDKYSLDFHKKFFIQEDIIFKLNPTVFCSWIMPDLNLIDIEGAVAFYFKDGVMTHPAGFIHNLEGVNIGSWSSKLGHGIMILHQLGDLAGGNSLYGTHLLCSSI